MSRRMWGPRKRREAVIYQAATGRPKVRDTVADAHRLAVGVERLTILLDEVVQLLAENDDAQSTERKIEALILTKIERRRGELLPVGMF